MDGSTEAILHSPSQDLDVLLLVGGQLSQYVMQVREPSMGSIHPPT